MKQNLYQLSHWFEQVNFPSFKKSIISLSVLFFITFSCYSQSFISTEIEPINEYSKNVEINPNYPLLHELFILGLHSYYLTQPKQEELLEYLELPYEILERNLQKVSIDFTPF